MIQKILEKKIFKEVEIFFKKMNIFKEVDIIVSEKQRV